MERKKHASIIRNTRKIHRMLGLSLFILFLIISCTGLLLGWKKNSIGYLLPKTQKGTSTLLADWLQTDSLQTIAFNTLHNSVNPNLSLEINRIDIRPKNGIVKFVFEDHYWEIQLDGATGKVLNIGKRHSDLIENIHDGSILDDLLGIDSGIVKLIYTSVIGLSLLGFTITGFWLWYGPKRMQKKREIRRNIKTQ